MSKIDAISPHTGEILKSFEKTAVNDIPKIIESLCVAQKRWVKTPIKVRLKLAKLLYKLMLNKKNILARYISQDVGKSEYEAFLTELIGSFSLLAYYLKNARYILKSKKIKHAFFKNKKSYLKYEALGVVSVITPWNYPFYLSFSPIIAALLAGNAVLFKPSEHSLFIGEKLHELFISAGFPSEVFQIVYGEGDLGKAIVDNNIQKVSFTGSVDTGKKIAVSTAKRFIPTTLELGGKDPFIVCDDAPFARAVKAAVWGNIINAGQTCSGVERIIVFRRISERFIKAIQEELDLLNLTGKYRSVASLNNKEQYDIVMKQMKDAIKNSDEILNKEFLKGETGLYNISPSFIIEPNESAMLTKKEIFGPLATIQIVENIDEAIELANDSNYGLTASIWTKNKKNMHRFISEVDAGSIYVNDHISPQEIGELPWGGFKNSGIGKSRGEEGLKSMTKSKVISIDRLNLKSEFFWQPYSKRKENLIKKLPNFFRFFYRLLG